MTRRVSKSLDRNERGEQKDLELRRERSSWVQKAGNPRSARGGPRWLNRVVLLEAWALSLISNSSLHQQRVTKLGEMERGQTGDGRWCVGQALELGSDHRRAETAVLLFHDSQGRQLVRLVHHDCSLQIARQ